MNDVSIKLKIWRKLNQTDYKVISGTSRLGKIYLYFHSFRRCYLQLSYIRIPMNWTHPLLKHSYSKIRPWISKFKVMSGVKCQDHIVSPTPYPFISLSFQVNRTPNSCNTTISKINLESSRSRLRVRQRSKPYMDTTSYQFIFYLFHVHWTFHSWHMAWYPEEARTWCTKSWSKHIR